LAGDQPLDEGPSRLAFDLHRTIRDEQDVLPRAGDNGCGRAHAHAQRRVRVGDIDAHAVTHPAGRQRVRRGRDTRYLPRQRLIGQCIDLDRHLLARRNRGHVDFVHLHIQMEPARVRNLERGCPRLGQGARHHVDHGHNAVPRGRQHRVVEPPPGLLQGQLSLVHAGLSDIELGLRRALRQPVQAGLRLRNLCLGLRKLGRGRPLGRDPILRLGGLVVDGRLLKLQRLG